MIFDEINNGGYTYYFESFEINVGQTSGGWVDFVFDPPINGMRET